MTAQLHIQVDAKLCQGTGYCERVAPLVFQVGDNDVANVVQPHPPDEQADLMAEAATLCPTRAITY